MMWVFGLGLGLNARLEPFLTRHTRTRHESPMCEFAHTQQKEINPDTHRLAKNMSWQRGDHNINNLKKLTTPSFGKTLSKMTFPLVNSDIITDFKFSFSHVKLFFIFSFCECFWFCCGMNCYYYHLQYLEWRICIFDGWVEKNFYAVALRRITKFNHHPFP